MTISNPGFLLGWLGPAVRGFTGTVEGTAVPPPVVGPPEDEDGWDGLSFPNPTSAWGMQDASEPVVDMFAANALSDIGNPTYQVLAADGNFRIETDFTDSLEAANSTFMNSDSADLSLLLRVHIPSTVPADRYLAGKYSGGAGWGLRVDSLGQVELFWDPLVGSTQVATVPFDHSDDTEHTIGMAIDATSSELRVFTGLGSVTLALASASGGNTAEFALGRIGLGGPENFGFRYAAAFDGYAITEANYDEFAALWP